MAVFYHSSVAFDQAENRIVVADTQRGRLQIYIKDKNYVDPQFNLSASKKAALVLKGCLCVVNVYLYLPICRFQVGWRGTSVNRHPRRRSARQ